MLHSRKHCWTSQQWHPRSPKPRWVRLDWHPESHCHPESHWHVKSHWHAKSLVLAAAIVVLAAAAAAPAQQPAQQPANKPNRGTPRTGTSGAAPSELLPADDPNFKRLTRAVIWEMEFAEGISAKDYARQLDFFQIELAAADSKGQLQYALRVSSPKPERRSGKLQDDSRVMIEWKTGNLPGFDRKFLAKAGIATSGKRILHFYSPAVERQLYDLEQAYAGADAPNIVRTRYGIRAGRRERRGHAVRVLRRRATAEGERRRLDEHRETGLKVSRGGK